MLAQGVGERSPVAHLSCISPSCRRIRPVRGTATLTPWAHGRSCARLCGHSCGRVCVPPARPTPDWAQSGRKGPESMINAAAPQSIELEQYVGGYAEAQSGMVDTVDPQSRPWQAAVAMIARMARRTG